MGRTLTIGGEGLLRQYALNDANTTHVDYVAYANTLTHWDKPWEQEPLPVDVQAAVLAFLREEFEQRRQLLVVE